MKTLILYASFHGVTTKCVEELSKRLGKPVDVVQLTSGTGPDLSKYSEVLLGSSVQAGSLHKKLRAFCDTNKEALLTKKLGLFVCCMDDDNPLGYLQKGLPEALVRHATVLAKIGGGYFFSNMNILMRAMFKKVVSDEVAKGKLPAAFDGKNDAFVINEEGMAKLAAAFG